MRRASFCLSLAMVVAAPGGGLSGQDAAAERVQTIYHFKPSDGSTGGQFVEMVYDGEGGLFGALVGAGGTSSCAPDRQCGEIFHLTPTKSPGRWKRSVIHTFTGYPDDGQNPSGGPVIGPGGVLYGTTPVGGNGPCVGDTGQRGCGAIYSLSPPTMPDGRWRKEILYNFQGGSDGTNPIHLVCGADGVLYRAAPGYGMYSLTPPNAPGGQWVRTAIVTSGIGDIQTLTMAPNGVIYGTGPKMAFSLTPPNTPGGPWTTAILHTFGGSGDGKGLGAPMTLDANGNLFGTTHFGGAHPCGNRGSGCGTVYELSPPAAAGGEWKETILYNFPGRHYGEFPYVGVAIGNNGAVYTSTPHGGNFLHPPTICLHTRPKNCGVLIELSPPASPGGNWVPTVLHRFRGEDGWEPAGITVTPDGSVYRVTRATIYALKP